MTINNSRIDFARSGENLLVTTPGDFVMNVGKDILDFLNDQPDIFIKNTGWQNGFGLDVAIWLPLIQSEHFLAEVMTDGDQFIIRRRCGSKHEFHTVIERVVTHFSGQ